MVITSLNPLGTEVYSEGGKAPFGAERPPHFDVGVKSVTRTDVTRAQYGTHGLYTGMYTGMGTYLGIQGGHIHQGIPLLYTRVYLS